MSRWILLAALLLCPALGFAQGIDYNAMNRGARMAEEANYRNFQRQQEFERRDAQQRELRYEQVAEHYLSNMVQIRQLSLSRGDTVEQFWRGQHQHILSDPVFQAYPAPLQEKILIRFRRWHDMLERGY